MPIRELLLGCGRKRVKEITLEGLSPEWSSLTTLDFNAAHGPDIVHDLDQLPYPFEDNSFDEIHAYEVMEHLGRQGDWKFFFAQFDELYRILKPDGQFYGTSPSWFSPWAWGDPGHTRIIGLEQFFYLSRPNYSAEVGVTAMTDYRFCYQGDFEPLVIDSMKDQNGKQIGRTVYVLQAKKPRRD
jgi:SAM-dependent methyltransferase